LTRWWQASWCFPGRSAGDEISHGHAPVADPPRTGRTQLGEFKVERCLALRSLLRGDRSFRAALACVR